MDQNKGPLTGAQFDTLVAYINRSVVLGIDALEDKLARRAGRGTPLTPERKASHERQVQDALQSARRALVGANDA